MQDIKWLVLIVLFGFSIAIFASMYASVYIAGLIMVATAYVAYVIKSDNPQAPNMFKEKIKGLE